MSDLLERLSTALADRYRLERELGQGGMATVYLARDLKHDRQVAIKVLKPELAAVLGAERFVQEITTTAQLQHPHILPLFDSGQADGFLYYVMPYIEGETLRTKLDREKQLGVEEAVKITTEVADALDYAHRHGVIHRDIKPENILLHDGRPMVADFGIALALSAAAGGRMTETGMSLGTPHYMSPEQATAEKTITNRSDIYSLGAVLYEMLTGEPPHTGTSAQQIIMRIVTEKPRSVSEARESVPPNVAAAVTTALQKLPADRFESAKAFAEALANPAFTTSTVVGGAPAAQSSRRPVVLMAALAAIAILATAFAAWGWLRSPPPLPSNHLPIALSERPIPPGLVGRNLTLSPDGRTIVFSDAVDGQRQLWIKTGAHAFAEPLSGTLDGVAPAFSPDGEWIAFVADGHLRKVPRSGGSAVTIADSASPWAPTVAWLENGTIAFGDGGFGLRIVGQDGGVARRWSPDSLGMGVLSLAGLPGGRAVLIAGCTPGCSSSGLMALDVEADVPHRLSESVWRAWYVRDGHVLFGRPDGSVFTAPFDLRTLEFTSPPIPVLNGVRTAANAVDLAVALNGTLLFVPGNAAKQAWEAVWVTRDGVATAVDSGWEFVPAAFGGGISMSPDGRRLALSVAASNSEDIWIKELDRGPLTRLTFEGHNTGPTWSADGEFVYYASRAEDGTSDARRRRADGTASAEVLLHSTKPVREVLPVPGTERTVVRLGVFGGADVFLADRSAGDSALSPLLANPAYDERSLALSPDGRWLAYASDESGRFEVYVRPFPDVGAGRWQVSRDGGAEPLWAHSGQELFYRSHKDDNFNLVAVTVHPGTRFEAEEPRVLFPTGGYWWWWGHAQYDITPDDRRFVFIRAIGSQDSVVQRTTAVLVENWLSDLEPGAPGGR